MRNNPFEALSIDIKPKALFQASSDEANHVKIEESIKTLSSIVYAGYNLREVIDKYLQDKDAFEDIKRKNEIIDTINLYSRHLLDEKLEEKDHSEKAKSLIKMFYNDNEPKKIQDALDIFVTIITDKFSIQKLLIAYFNGDQNYSTLSSATGVDLDEDISKQIQEKDEKENSQPEWEYIELYSWFKKVLIPSIESNSIKYLLPCKEKKTAQIISVFIKKYLPVEDHELLNTDKELRKKRLYEFAEKIIRILWLNEQLFEEPIYLARCNYTGKSASEIDYLYDNNIVSICIEDDETPDKKYYNDLIKGNNPPYNNKLPYIHRFVKLINLVKEQDVIIIATYLGKNPKIGLIKKGTEVFCKIGNEFKLFCLKMKSVYCTPNLGEYIESIDLSSYPIIKSIIPQQVTISAVNQRKDAIYGIFYGVKYPLDLSLMTNSAIEIMCSEWLRSRFANEKYRIFYQIIKTGGNFADIDILGANNENKIVAAQVSNTTNINLVRKKIDKLKLFASHEKIMFSNVSNENLKKIDNCLNIYIEDVWKDFYSDSSYNVMLKRLINL